MASYRGYKPKRCALFNSLGSVQHFIILFLNQSALVCTPPPFPPAELRLLREAMHVLLRDVQLTLELRRVRLFARQGSPRLLCVVVQVEFESKS